MIPVPSCLHEISIVMNLYSQEAVSKWTDELSGAATNMTLHPNCKACWLNSKIELSESLPPAANLSSFPLKMKDHPDKMSWRYFLLQFWSQSKTGNKADSCAPQSWRGEAVRQVLALVTALLNATGRSFPCQLPVIKERHLDGVRAEVPSSWKGQRRKWAIIAPWCCCRYFGCRKSLGNTMPG